MALLRSNRYLVNWMALGCHLTLWLPNACGEEPVHATAARTVVSHKVTASRARRSSDEIGDLVDQLDADDFAARESASARLLETGRLARDPLLAAADSPNPEIRSRARRLLVLIDQLEFDRQLAAFAADVDGRLGLTLPGWEEFQAIVGGENLARCLFVETQRHESNLLKRVFADRDPKSDELLYDLVAELNNWQRRRVPARRGIVNVSPPLASCVAALFVGAAMAADPSFQAANADAPASRNASARTTAERLSERTVRALGQLAVKPPLNSSTSTGTNRREVRGLLAHWIIHCPGERQNVVEQKLNLLVVHELAEALSFAAKIATNEPPNSQLHPRYRAQAVLAIDRFGTEQQVADLESLLTDASKCYDRSGRNHSGQRYPPTVVKLGDVVLAVFIHRSGQELATYGFRDVKRDEQSLFKLNTLGFERDEDRSAALARWQNSQSIGGQ